LHFGQLLLGMIMDSSLGRRQATTLIKLPIQEPKINGKIIW